MSGDQGASVPDRALVSDEAAARLHPSGFDPSRTHQWDDTDWHVFAQWVAHHWSHAEEVAIAYQAAAETAKILRAEMERRDRNENRNCLNWGPCSRHDGHMHEATYAASAMSGSAQDAERLGPKGASAVPQADAQTPPESKS